MTVPLRASSVQGGKSRIRINPDTAHRAPGHLAPCSPRRLGGQLKQKSPQTIPKPHSHAKHFCLPPASPLSHMGPAAGSSHTPTPPVCLCLQNCANRPWSSAANLEGTLVCSNWTGPPWISSVQHRTLQTAGWWRHGFATQILALPYPCCATSGKCPHLSEPQSLHL